MTNESSSPLGAASCRHGYALPCSLCAAEKTLHVTASFNAGSEAVTLSGADADALDEMASKFDLITQVWLGFKSPDRADLLRRVADRLRHQTPTCQLDAGDVGPPFTDEEVAKLRAWAQVVDLRREPSCVRLELGDASICDPDGCDPGEWSEEYWVLDQALMDAKELPRTDGFIATLKAIRDRFDSRVTPGETPDA